MSIELPRISRRCIRKVLVVFLRKGGQRAMEVDIDVACSTTHQYARKTPSALAEHHAGHSYTSY